MSAVLVTNYDDWEALYINGKCVEQDHKVNIKKHLKKIIGELEEVEVNPEYTYEVGYLPDNYSDIPQEAFLCG